jgi:hypothetical protein
MYYSPFNQNQQYNQQMNPNMGQGIGMSPDMGSGMGMGNDMGMGNGMGMGMDQGTSGSDILLEDDIIRAIIAEVHAYNFYEELMNLTMDEEDRFTIQQIQRDEAKHYHWFTMILRRMGGQMPQIPAGDIPSDFTSGVRTAIRNELEAAAFYQDIAYRATDHRIQMHFMHASHDEQRHATLFQNMLINAL